MSNITKLLIRIFSIFVLVSGTLLLWTQDSHSQDNIELPSISQETKIDDENPQNEQLHVKTLKKRPYLTKKDTHQHTIPKKRVSPFPKDINNVILPFPPIIDTQIQFFLLDPDMALVRLMYEYKQGKIDLDYVVEYLESQYIYDPAILKKLEPRRAFRYLAATLVSSDIVKAYAERILTKDPDNPYARARMVRYEQDNAKAAALYREILINHPDHPPTLFGLGYCLLDNSPKEAIQYLKKANRLEPTSGLISLAMAYEKLGDVKTAWFCYKKNITIRKLRKFESSRFPPPQRQVDFFYPVDETNLRAIEGGRHWRSVIKLVPDPKQQLKKGDHQENKGVAPHMVKAFQPVNAQQKREIQEFYQFRDWVNHIAKTNSFVHRNDFLAKEIDAHLKNGKPIFAPERIVRAYEITIRYPGKEGLQRLKKTDPEVVLEIERLMQQQSITPN